METKKPLALTLYVPFCKERCGMCDALVFTETTAAEKETYANALCTEITALAPELSDYEVTSVFITGGCPNLLGNKVLCYLFDLLRDSFDLADDCEITLAACPTNISGDLISDLTRLGLTRLEFETETFDALQHFALDISYTHGSINDIANVLRSSQYHNFDVSLLWGIEGQSIPSVTASVENCAQIGATHITFAPLRIIEGTPLFDTYQERLANPSTSPRHIFPDDSRRHELYHTGLDALKQLGYERYTQYHFARPGFVARHILNDINAVDKVSFGLGATSYYDGVACTNTSDLATYEANAGNYQKLIVDAHIVEPHEAALRALSAGLFAVDGIDRAAFADRWGEDPLTSCACIADFRDRGWLEETADALRLTDEGGFHYAEIRDKILASV